MKKEEIFWGSLLILASVAALLFIGKFTLEIYRYYRLDRQAPVEINSWSVKELSDSKFVLQATYTYRIGPSTFSREHAFTTTLFPNEYAAQYSLPFWESNSWTVWYNHSNPAISSLQKVFPLRATLHMVFSLAILLYFSWLRILDPLNANTLFRRRSNNRS